MSGWEPVYWRCTSLSWPFHRPFVCKELHLKWSNVDVIHKGQNRKTSRVDRKKTTGWSRNGYQLETFLHFITVTPFWRIVYIFYCRRNVEAYNTYVQTIGNPVPEKFDEEELLCCNLVPSIDDLTTRVDDWIHFIISILVVVVTWNINPAYRTSFWTLKEVFYVVFFWWGYTSGLTFIRQSIVDFFTCSLLWQSLVIFVVLTWLAE